MIQNHRLAVMLMVASLNVWGVAQQRRADVCPDDAQDFARVQDKSAANDPASQTALASCYDLGRHVQPNGKESIRWLTAAANQGYAPAEYELGRIYLYGRGVPADYPQALRWERGAADQGDPRAQRDLAFMYERGFGVPVDPAQAAEWNRKAATQGQPEAQLHLAQALETGAGIQKNSTEADHWYVRAARQEQPAAQLALARKLAQGPDCAAAIHWYKEAAAQGESAAMRELGQLYLTAKCGSDRSQAFLWLTIAARFGSIESKADAGKLEEKLSVAQKQRARLAAEHWIQKHSGARKEED
jgi:TPR repeat protein